jgi:NADH-quinone oxidoreductase subunit L
MAMVSRDIKQVWAYSTISQLGFMIMGLAAGGFFAGVFHLTTHAGFKALLFLCSGVFIHHADSNDMYDIGRRGGRHLKIPMVCIVMAAAALAGLPPLSGFFSKEAVLGALADLNNPWWVIAGLLGAFLTAYYAFRLIFILLFPKKVDHRQDSDHDTHHRRHTYWVMAWPLIILAGVSLILGFFQGQLEIFLRTPSLSGTNAGGAHHDWLPFVALGLAFGGIGLAWLEFGRRGSEQIGFVERLPALNNLFSQRWYMDRFYRRFLDTIIYNGFSRLFTFNDNNVIDGGIDGLSKGTVESGRFVSYLHTGMVQYRLLAIFIILVLLMVYFLF